VGARAPGRRPWGCINTLYRVISKRVLSRNFDQSMLKIAYFWKNVKIASASGAPPSDPRVFIPAYYCNLGQFVSSGKCISLLAKANKITPAESSTLLLPHFCNYFSCQTLQFCYSRTQKIFLAPGRRIP